MFFFCQSHYIEVAQGAIFIEQKMRFGLILGRLSIQKKKKKKNENWADYEQLLRAVFSCFHEQKKSTFLGVIARLFRQIGGHSSRFVK